MNQPLIKTYLQAYKDQFAHISNQELYKWEAVKQFQDHWDIEAEDFYAMLQTSLSSTENLLMSGMYFPKGMLVETAEVQPEAVRDLFKTLYSEEEDLLYRIEAFRAGMKELIAANFDVKNDYQDHRAVVVYLVLKYPERYYLYKFGMFKTFASKINYTYTPVKGRIENVSHFNNMCDILKPIIVKDQELLRLHNARLTTDCYIDEDYNILTQDFIYAVAQHLDTETILEPEVITEIAIKTVATSGVHVTTTNVSFNGSITNHIQNNKENKRIGDLGELFVIQLEKEKLLQANKPKLANKVAHHAKDKGDGLGYDVLSFDTEGNKMFIEVKATKSNKNTPFFITRNELERSKQEQDNFFIYRVYNFNDAILKGDVLVLQGDASNLCIEAVNYKVKMS
ncbi:protein NO VEIN domain-containing protein [Polaribacter sp. OB-PA-B3]